MKILLWKRLASGMDDMPQRGHPSVSLNPLHSVSRHRHLLEIAFGNTTGLNDFRQLLQRGGQHHIQPWQARRNDQAGRIEIDKCDNRQRRTADQRMNSIRSRATLGVATVNNKRIVRRQIAHYLRSYRMDVIKGLQVLDDQQGIVADFSLENCAEIHS